MSYRQQICFLLIAGLVICLGCSSDTEQKNAHFEKGKAFFEQKDYKNAELEFKNAVQIDPTFVAAYEKLSETHIKLGNAREAFSAIRQVVELDPANMDAQLKLATFFLLARRVKESKARVEHILTEEPENIPTLYLSARIHLIEKNSDKAAIAYNKILKINNKQTQARLGLSKVLTVQGKVDAAETTLKEAIEFDPKAVKPKLALFRFYSTKGDFESAEKVMQQSIANHPQHPNLYIVLGNFHYRQKNLQKAEQAYLKAIDLDPKNTSSYVVTAGFYEFAGQTDKSLAMYRKALDLNPHHIQAMQGIARVSFKNKDFDKAEKQIGKILKQKPQSVPIRILKGELLIRKGKIDEAITIFDKLIIEDSQNARAHYSKAFAHVNKDELELAKSELNKATELSPRYKKAGLLLMQIHMRERNFDLALQRANDILKQFPKYYQAVMIRGNALMGQGKAKEAQFVFESAIAIDSKNPSGYYRLGMAYYKTGDKRKAKKELEKALNLSNTFEGVMEAKKTLAEL
ncbi:tetratricopeptide repeat protein [Thermodesulfobacteriota bacterium]